MPFYNITKMSTFSDGSPLAVSNRYRDDTNSPRVNGKLKLRANTATVNRAMLTHLFWMPGTGMVKPPQGDNYATAPGTSYTSVDNIAYNRWRGKLFKGSASLGVTAASWKQSRDMIVQRHQHLQRTLDSAYYALKKHPGAVKRLRRERQPLANQVLETEFGWRPLIADVHAALFTVCKGGVPPEWVTGSGREQFFYRTSSKPFDNRVTQEWSGSIKTSYGCKVVITNENLWLLNRLGLINPLTVAWDLIPWSFVVNMFVNVNSLLNSVTDTVGLDLSEHCITRTRKQMHVYTDVNEVTKNMTTSTVVVSRKQRILDVPLKPKIEVRVPELNWELALIASSLVLQKFKAINKIIGIV